MREEIARLFDSTKKVLGEALGWWECLTSTEKAAWLQAIGSLLALVVAIGVPWWLAVRSERARARSKALVFAPVLAESVARVQAMSDAVPARGPEAGKIPQKIRIPSELDPAMHESHDFDRNFLQVGVSEHTDSLHDFGGAAKPVQRYVQLLNALAEKIEGYRWRATTKYSNQALTNRLEGVAKAMEPDLVRLLRKTLAAGVAAQRRIERL